MKYKIEVSGRGCEVFAFELSEKQIEKIYDCYSDFDKMSYDEICEILEVEDYYNTDNNFFGLYNGKNHGEYLIIVVYDESGNVIWESPIDFNFNDIEKKYEYSDEEVLLIEDYQKGSFFIYEIDIVEEFNPQLLSCVIIDILDGMCEIITDIKYNGKDIDIKDYGDTTSKGYIYKIN